MLKHERHNYIMHHINLHNRVLTSELVHLMQVSEDTVRRDLDELLHIDMLHKVRGGAVSKYYHSSFDYKDVYAKENKVIIAKKANQLIKDGMVIITGGGSTVLEFVKHLPQTLKATFYTISPQVAVELAKYDNLEIIMLGGMFSKNSQITFGAHLLTQLSDIRADLLVMGTSAIDAFEGLTDTDLEINNIKKALLSTSRKTAVLCISEKLNTVHKLRVCYLDKINYLITEFDSSNDLVQVYKSKITQVL